MAEDRSYRSLSDALRAVIARPELLRRLSRQDTRNAAMAELGIDAEVRTEILTIMNEVTAQGISLDAAQADGGVAPSRPSVKPVSRQEEAEAIGSARRFLEDSFGQVRQAYRVSILMSGVVFLAGLAFLGLAAYRSVAYPGEVTTTSVVAGIGVVQIVALFYRNPLTHIARTMSNAQQARMAVTSYLLGLQVLYDQMGLSVPTPEHLEQLGQLTDRALAQMQRFVEEKERSEPRGSE